MRPLRDSDHRLSALLTSVLSALLKIMRSQQVVLDRLREARTAVGLHGFNVTIHREFINILYPYRLHSQRLSRTLFYLSATSLMCKTQLARDVPSARSTFSSFEHDALVLSRRLSNLPWGRDELQRPGFLRYWFYLVSLGSISSELEELERYLGEVRSLPRLPPSLLLLWHTVVLLRIPDVD